MSIAFKVRRGSGDYVRASVVPANHADEPHFGLFDASVLVAALLVTGGLIYLLS